jgi:hypothetical protein
MVDCHDGRMISKLVMVHVGGFLEHVFITIIDWAAIDLPTPLENYYHYLRNRQKKFGTVNLARKSLDWGMDNIRSYYSRSGEGNSEGTESSE